MGRKSKVRVIARREDVGTLAIASPPLTLRHPSPLVGFNITEVKSKGYSGNDKLLYQVKVEKIYDYGPNIVAAFAHESPTVMADFRDTIAELILVGRNGGASPQGGGNRVKAASGSGPSGIGGGGIGGGGASSFPPPAATAPTPQPSSVSRATQQRKQGGSGGAYNFEQLTLD